LVIYSSCLKNLRFSVVSIYLNTFVLLPQDAMNCAEDFLKFVSNWVAENLYENLYFLSKRVDKTILDRLNSLASMVFEKITYTTAVEVLSKVTSRF